jgi:transcriptional regulator with XRE-family HTH domain
MHVRDTAGLSGRKLAGMLGSNQGKIWRIESGTQLPTVPLVKDWLTACGMAEDSPQWQRLVDLAEAAHGETRPWGDLLAGVGHLQGVARDRETGARLVRNFQPTIVPGLLQTPEYATRIMPLADITGTIDHAAAVSTRLQRQQVLYEEGHRFEFLLVEAALRLSVQMGEVTPAQMDRIVSLAKLPSVGLAVVPVGRDVVAPWHNFILWEPREEDPYVTTELFHGEQRITDVSTVALYRGLWSRMWDAAVTGDEAVDLIRAPC